jgi:hypothetical protein
MPADRHLNTVLLLYQDLHDDAKTDQIFGSTTSLLTTLRNPLNLGLLTSQLLIAPAIWQRRDGLRTSFRIISVFNSAAIRVREYEVEGTKHKGPRQGGGLTCEQWARAVVKGADDRSSRWQHLLVLVGVLMGMEGEGRRSLSGSLRNTLEQAVVTAANLSLENPLEYGQLGATSVVLALNYAFPLLSDFNKSMINSNALLPSTIMSMTSEDGFNDGVFLGQMNPDLIMQTPDQKLSWPPASPSFLQFQTMGSRPLIGSMGGLVKLTAHAVQYANNSSLVLEAQDALLEFTRRFLDQWQSVRFSEIELSEEASKITPDTLQAAWPLLWNVLNRVLYTTVGILQTIVSRSLLDRHLRSDSVAPVLSTKSLHILRNLYFISSRPGASNFQIYAFTYLTSIDTIVRYPEACIAFLTATQPINPNIIPQWPLHRILDLFYLNIAEHMPLNLPTVSSDGLIVQPATAYLYYNGPQTSTMVELFEAAHSAILSVLACPHNSPLTVRLVPFYIDALLSAFPERISTRQFRLAFKTVMQIVSPPFPISATNPELSETLLEMIRWRAAGANTALLPPTRDVLSRAESDSAAPEPMSEQSSLVLTLVDSLPFLPLVLVEDWLTITAETLNIVADPALRQAVRDRFLEILVSGEMDVERAAIGVAWWGTKGGRELVLGKRSLGLPMMSGAIMADETNASRL